MTEENGLVPVNKGGRPPHEPDERTRAIVEGAVAFGITQDDIATHLFDCAVGLVRATGGGDDDWGRRLRRSGALGLRRRLLSELNEVERVHADENYRAILARSALLPYPAVSGVAMMPSLLGSAT